jgi:hypothetical protein
MSVALKPVSIDICCLNRCLLTSVALNVCFYLNCEGTTSGTFSLAVALDDLKTGKALPDSILQIYKV